MNSTPTPSGGLLFVGSMDRHVYALRLTDGAVVWKFLSGTKTFKDISYGGVRSSPLIRNGVVFIGGCDGVVRALDEHKGTLLWAVDTRTEGCYSSPSLAGDTLYVGSDGVEQVNLFALDPATSAVRWKFPTPTQIFSTPAVADGVVYVHARNDHIYALNAQDGTVLWKTPAPSPQDQFAVLTDIAKSSPAVARGKVLVGIDRDLVALDAKTGVPLWRAPTGRSVHSSPLVVGQTVYVGSDDRQVYAFDLGSGRKTWSYATKGKVSVSPEAGEGLLLIGSDDGMLYAFEAVKK